MKLLLCVITILLVQTVDLAQKASVKSEALFLNDLRPTVVKILFPNIRLTRGASAVRSSVAIVVDENGIGLRSDKKITRHIKGELLQSICVHSLDRPPEVVCGNQTKA